MQTTLTEAARALGDQPAFPSDGGRFVTMTDDGLKPFGFSGLTKREYFIGQALAGNIRGATLLEETAYGAICMASAILNALTAEHQPEQPKADDGWIEWEGGNQPVGDVVVQVKFTDGSTGQDMAYRYCWGSLDAPIIAYRIVPPAEPEPSCDLRTVAGGGTLTLEVGKTYRSEDGQHEGIVEKLGNTFISEAGGKYAEDGRCRLMPSFYDLIELVDGE